MTDNFEKRTSANVREKAITRMFDKELYKIYLFTEYLAKLLPRKPSEKINIDDKVQLEFTNLRETFSGSIELKRHLKTKY